MIWNQQFECMSASDLKQLQSERLCALVEYICANCSVMKQRFASAGISPSDIKSIDDIVRLPFTTKIDMRDNYPYGLFCTEQSKVQELHVSSGTTGNPTLVGYTKADLELWGEVMARSLACAGAEPGDTVQNAYGYGLFTGGLGVHYGALTMGLRVIPTSSGQTQRQLKIMQDFKPKVITCTPSYALYMAEEALENGINPQDGNWKIGIFGAEPWTERMRSQIESQWNMLATDIYGLSEIIGPGVAQECSYKEGLHIYSDVFYPEIIDPTTDQPVAEGQSGELVITTLTKQAIPLLRYRTRDIVSITAEKCRCGRTSPRISKIKGRTDDMIVIRGINVFPSQIEHVLLGIEETEPHYQIIVDRDRNSLDNVEVLVEISSQFFSDEVKKLEELKRRIKSKIETVLSIGVKVTLVEPKGIERSMGKSKRVIDRRHL